MVYGVELVSKPPHKADKRDHSTSDQAQRDKCAAADYASLVWIRMFAVVYLHGQFWDCALIIWSEK